MTETHEKIERKSHLRWVVVDDISVSEHAQREFKSHLAAKIAASYTPEKLGIPTLSFRDERYWVVEGQHRLGALKLLGYGQMEIQCDVFEGLSEQEEADMFDGLNDRTNVPALEKFRVRVFAGRTRECDIQRTVAANGLTIGDEDGQIAAVGALARVYDMAGAERLGIALRVLSGSWGEDALRSEYIKGMGAVAHRYNGLIDEKNFVAKLSSMRGGMGGLATKASLLREKVGRPASDCIAAAIVETVKIGADGKKLPNWWS